MNKENSQDRPPIYKKWWFWVIIVIVIIAIGGAIGSNNKEPQKIGEEGTSQSEGTNSSNKIFKPGDVIAVDGREIVVSNVERNFMPGNEFVKPKDGNEFVQINVDIKNVSSDNKSYNLLDWQIEDANGALESVDIMGTGADDKSLDSGDLTAGGKKSGTLVFQVPKGQAGLKLHYKPLLSTASEAIIEL